MFLRRNARRKETDLPSLPFQPDGKQPGASHLPRQDVVVHWRSRNSRWRIILEPPEVPHQPSSSGSRHIGVSAVAYVRGGCCLFTGQARTPEINHLPSNCRSALPTRAPLGLGGSSPRWLGLIQTLKRRSRACGVLRKSWGGPANGTSVLPPPLCVHT